MLDCTRFNHQLWAKDFGRLITTDVGQDAHSTTPHPGHMGWCKCAPIGWVGYLRWSQVMQTDIQTDSSSPTLALRKCVGPVVSSTGLLPWPQHHAGKVNFSSIVKGGRFTGRFTALLSWPGPIHFANSMAKGLRTRRTGTCWNPVDDAWLKTSHFAPRGEFFQVNEAQFPRHPRAV